MTPTIEQIKEILAGAEQDENHWLNMGGVTRYTNLANQTHNLSDLRTILAQHEEIERLNARIKEMSELCLTNAEVLVIQAEAVEEAVKNTPTHKMKVDNRLYHSQRALLEHANKLREQSK